MSGFMILKSIGVVNAYRKPILVATLLAMIIGISVSGKRAYSTTPKEATKVSALASTEIGVLSKQIKQLVKGLEYSDKVAQDFVKMVSGWKDAQGRPVLVVWKQRLNQAKQDYKQGKISKAKLSKVEESIAKELSQRVRKEISYNEKFFDLADVIKNRQAQCLGYSQLVYILGNSIGLSVQAIDVVETVHGPLVAGYRHAACLVELVNDKIAMVDLAFGPIISKPFKLEEQFTKAGNYWELKDKDNPLGIHRRIQILDKNGLLADVYTNQGLDYVDLGQYQKAISDYNRAIELDPKEVEAYYNRGNVYKRLGQYTKAISDLTKAIELNPKFAGAYNNRGNVYDHLGQYTKAMSDFNKAIKLNPKNAAAYNNRGNAYRKLGRYLKAISDYTKAIELNPKLPDAYSNRGNVYNQLGQRAQAISDLTKAIEFNPKFAEAYINRGVIYAFLGKFEQAKKDLLKAIELDASLKTHVKKVSVHFKLNLKLD